jgi:hypothetical protein
VNQLERTLLRPQPNDQLTQRDHIVPQRTSSVEGKLFILSTAVRTLIAWRIRGDRIGDLEVAA